jgi:hypothetical protein
VTVSPLDKLIHWIAELGVCGNSGLILGSIVGGVLGLIGLHHENHHDLSLAPGELIALWIILGAFAWLALLFILVALLRMRLRGVLAPTLVNAALVALLVIGLAQLLGAYQLGWLLGPLLGALVGSILCRLNSAGAVDK